MTPWQMLDAMDAALAEADRQLATGEQDQPGRLWSDEELAAGSAMGRLPECKKSAEVPAA